MTKADGTVSKEEIDVTDTFFREVMGFDREKCKSAIEVFRRSKESTTSYGDIAHEYLRLVGGQLPLLHAVIQVLMAVALVDGPLTREEEDFVSSVAGIFRLSDSAYSHYRQQRDASEHRMCQTHEQKRIESLAILGLSGRPTTDVIKRAYKDLVMQCHPDRIQHLGPRLRDIAEQEMKRINIGILFPEGTHQCRNMRP